MCPTEQTEKKKKTLKNLIPTWVGFLRRSDHLSLPWWAVSPGCRFRGTSGSVHRSVSKCKGTWTSQYATSGSLNGFKCRLCWESNLGHIKRPWRYWTFLTESQSFKRFHLLESFGGTKLESLLSSHFQGHARDCVRKSLKMLEVHVPIYSQTVNDLWSNYNLRCFPVPCQNASHHQAITYI